MHIGCDTQCNIPVALGVLCMSLLSITSPILLQLLLLVLEMRMFPLYKQCMPRAECQGLGAGTLGAAGVTRSGVLAEEPRALAGTLGESDEFLPHGKGEGWKRRKEKKRKRGTMPASSPSLHHCWYWYLADTGYI